MSNVLSKLPKQRKTYRSKNKTWRKQNLDYADKYSFYNNEIVRNTLKNRVINLNLYNGRISPEDMSNTLNPHGLTAEFMNENIPHKPIIVPKIDILVGEEINRKFDWFATLTNPDSISMKEKDKAKMVRQKLTSIMQENLEKEELEAEMKSLDRYMRYDWQDMRERMANQLLKHYYSEQNFDRKFNEGFKEALIMGEEIYKCDVIGKEPVLEKLNPLKVHSVRSGNSNRIEDSDLIIIEDHWSPGRIIDTFYEDLKGIDIDKITEFTNKTSSGKYTTDDENHLLLRDNAEATINSYLSIAEVNGHLFTSDYVDATGNMRVLTVMWRSQKKIKKVKFYDEFGETQEKIVSEEYIVDKGRGEEEVVYWVNEWWEGYKIGKEIYIRMRPRQIQYNRLNNPSYCHPGIVGEVYNTNQGRSVSLVDRMKNYQYLYDVIWDRLNKAIAKNLGKILLLDIAVVPNGWEPEKWLAQATNMGLGLVDGFKEGNQGMAQGKIAGNLNGATNTRAIDLETGNYIQQHISLLEFIKLEMGEIAGVNKQREGQVSNRETLGGIERAVTQSSHITEWWFMKHEDVKKRVLSVFLETAKFALKGGNKKLQYIADDMSKVILDIDGDEIQECDFGITITTSTVTKQLKDSMTQLAQAFMQNGGSFSTIIDIMTSPSIADMRKKIEYQEDEAKQIAMESDRIKNEQAKEAMAQEQANAEVEQDLEKYKVDVEAETKLRIALLNSEDKALDRESGDEGDGSDDAKLQLDYKKAKDDLLVKMKKLDQDWEIHKDKMVREDKKIAKPTASAS